jgi:hypothetical protein
MFATVPKMRIKKKELSYVAHLKDKYKHANF